MWSFALIPADSAFTTVLVLVAGAMAGGFIFNLSSSRDRELRMEHLLVAVMCASTTAYLLLEATLYRAHDIATHALIRRCEEYAVAPFVVGYALSIASVAGWRLRPAALVGCVAALVLVVATASSSAGLWLIRIDRLQTLTLPWGEQLMMAQGPPSAWMAYSLGVWLSLAGVGLWASIRHLRRGSAVGGRLLIAANLAALLTIVHDALLDQGLLHDVFLSEFISAILISAMWWRVSRLRLRREDAWRHLFDSSADAILIVDPENGRIVDLDPAACHKFGLGRVELLDMTVGALLIDAAGAAQLESRLKAVHGTAAVLIEQRCRGVDSGFPAEISLRSTSLEGHQRLVVTFRDLTERRTAEQAIRDNERRLARVFELCPIAMAETDADGVPLRLNPSLVRSYGEPDHPGRQSGPDQVGPAGPGGPGTSRPQWRLPPPPAEAVRRLSEPAESPSAMWLNPAPLPEAKPVQASITDGNGIVHPSLISSVAVGDRNFTFLVDLTATLAANDALAQQEALQRTIIERAADGVIAGLIEDGRAEPAIREWNARMQEISGRDLEQAAGGWRQLVAADAEGGDQRYQDLAQLWTHANVRHQPIELVRPDGELRQCTASAAIIHREEGQRWLVAMVRDVSEEHRSEQERERLEMQIEQTKTLEGLGVLAGGIAHDLNNLLTAVLGRCSLLRAALTDGESQRHLGAIGQATQRAADLCRQLLSYAGKGRTQVMPLSLMQLVRDSSWMINTIVPKRITVVQRLAEVPPIQADVDQLRQVLLNIVSNAAEAIGDRHGSIIISVMPTTIDEPRQAGPGLELMRGRHALLEVTDTGSGMDAPTLSRIFEPFFTTRFTGRGLGMAAVLGIVRNHRGGIEIESVVSVGTTIRVLLPIDSPGASPSSSSSSTYRRRRVLVVEDEEMIRGVVEEMLGHLRLRSLSAGTGEAALDLLRSERDGFHTLLIDLGLPDLSAEEVIQVARKRYPEIRLVLVSGANNDSADNLIRIFPDAVFLQKPYALETLRAAVIGPRR